MGMTLEEKRVAIEEYCDGMSECNWCPLRGTKGSCWDNKANIEENYRILFGSEEPDNVNHPSHYQGKHECIDEMIAMFGVEAVKHFCMCNVYKYRYRASAKNGQEDLDKADWYMSKLMELQKESGGSGKSV